MCKLHCPHDDRVSPQVSSRKVLQAVLDRRQVPADLFSPVCVVVDKIEKIGADKVRCSLGRG